MRLIKFKVLIALLTIPILTSCGTDMRDWPYADLHFNVDEATAIYIDYFDKTESNKSIKYYSQEVIAIDEIYNLLTNTHVNPNITNSTKEMQKYNKKISIYFLLNDDIYDFKAYICGLDTYFFYNDEIRVFPADFESGFFASIDNVVDYLTIIN